MKLILLLSVFTLLIACSISPSYVNESQPLLQNHLPLSDAEVNIANLGRCTESKGSTFRFNSNYPITVLVHGRYSAVKKFSMLAQLYAFHGHQTVCFSYRDRDSLILSADKLISSLQQLMSVSNNKSISIIGHSLGGLIARKALENRKLNNLSGSGVNVKLITVAAPFAGVAAAQPCAYRTLNWLSLGIIPGICWVISGDNWYEITSNSDFIKYPKPLSPSVQRYLKVVTNEQNRCRRKNKLEKCIESDYVFGLSEQYNPVIDSYPQVTNIQVDAGHVEIIGNKQLSPLKLLAILQQEDMLSAKPRR